MDFDNSKEWALFKGIEQEGPNKGALTLFVVGDVPLQKICKEIYDHRIGSVYFGAGGRFDYNYNTVHDLLFLNLATYPINHLFIESPKYQPAAHKLLKYKWRWIIPFIWKGEILDEGLESIRYCKKNLSYFEQDEVFGKIDTGLDVLISKLSSISYNVISKNYDADVLLASKER